MIINSDDNNNINNNSELCQVCYIVSPFTQITTFYHQMAT